jgi:MFS family permease
MRPAATVTARRAWPAALSRHSLPAAVVLVLIAALSFVRRTDPDYWWHLRAGRDILATGSLPRVDLYSHTMAGQPWVAHSWLWEVVLALVADTAGYAGVSALLAGLLLASFGLLYRLLRARGLVEWAAAALVLLGALMSVQTLTARPHAVTYLGVITTLWLLEWWRRGQARRLWWMLPLLALWANVHGGYAIGLAVLGLALAGEWLEARLAGRPARLRTLAAVLAGGLVAASLNPQGPAIHLFAAGFLSRESAMQRYIQEWASPDFHDWPGMAFAVGLVLLALTGLRPARIGWPAALVALAFAWLGLQSVRHVPLFALGGLPALAAGLAAWPPLAARPRPPEPPAFAAVNWLAVAIIAAGAATVLLSQPLAQVGREPLEEWYPQAARAYLERARPAGPLFNYDGWGGYLIARAPDYPVYIDGRTDLYGVALAEEYRRTVRLEPGWRETLDRRGIRLVLVRREQALASALRDDPGWRLVLEGEVEALFERAV